MKLVIYDRWGETIFATTGELAFGREAMAWDGMYNGTPTNTAVFIYYLVAHLSQVNK